MDSKAISRRDDTTPPRLFTQERTVDNALDFPAGSGILKRTDKGRYQPFSMARKRTAQNRPRSARWTVEPVSSASEQLLAHLLRRIAELEAEFGRRAPERVIQ
jgi:hypothetical protein